MANIDPHIRHTLQHYFAGQPVIRAYLFGSLARGQDHAESDIDVLIEFAKGATLFDQARMVWQLEELLHRKVDVVSESGLSPLIRPFINQDKILVYERKSR
ncbi:nucleotidyltransferase family protein [Larkinella soli]|uniref:nucleotidyltransferase family protein n=1 Tax=Larkinella soli TaxID=1770527 RepID=UPI000FFCB133|nr:nucleotidyltransferase family protein [Larkinella soli]